MDAGKQAFQKPVHLLLLIINHRSVQEYAMPEALYNLFIIKFQTIAAKIRKFCPEQRIIILLGKCHHIKAHFILIQSGMGRRNNADTVNFRLQLCGKLHTQIRIHNISFNQLLHHLNGILKFHLIIQKIAFRCHKFPILHNAADAFRRCVMIQLIPLLANGHMNPVIQIMFVLHGFFLLLIL